MIPLVIAAAFINSVCAFNVRSSFWEKPDYLDSAEYRQLLPISNDVPECKDFLKMDETALGFNIDLNFPFDGKSEQAMEFKVTKETVSATNMVPAIITGESVKTRLVIPKIDRPSVVKVTVNRRVLCEDFEILKPTQYYKWRHPSA